MNKIFKEISSAEISLCYDMTMDCIHNCIPILIKHLDIEKIWIERVRLFEETEMTKISSFNDNDKDNTYVDSLKMTHKKEYSYKTPLRYSRYPLMTTLQATGVQNGSYGFIVSVHFSQCVHAFKRLNIHVGIISYEFLKEVIVYLIHEMIHVQQFSGITPGFADEDIEDESKEELIDRMEKYAYANMNKFFDMYKEELDYVINACLSKFTGLLDLDFNYWFTKDRIDTLS